MALEKELETYKRKLPQLKNSEGKFILVHGDDADVFAAYEDALRAGYQRYGLNAFMVKQIKSFEQAQLITRLVVPTPV